MTQTLNSENGRPPPYCKS